jgi:hypothetical protein
MPRIPRPKTSPAIPTTRRKPSSPVDPILNDLLAGTNAALVYTFVRDAPRRDLNLLLQGLTRALDRTGQRGPLIALASLLIEARPPRGADDPHIYDQRVDELITELNESAGAPRPALDRFVARLLTDVAAFQTGLPSEKHLRQRLHGTHFL